MSGARHRRKGDRVEREIVARHIEIGIHAERYPLSGSTRFRNSGHDLDAIEATVAGCGIPLTILEPRVWKQFHRLRGDNKELSRQCVLQLFRSAHALFTHKKDHGRAEAALIALAGAKHQPAQLSLPFASEPAAELGEGSCG